MVGFGRLLRVPCSLEVLSDRLDDKGVEVIGGVGESLLDILVSMSSLPLTCSDMSLSHSGQGSMLN